MIFNIWAHYKQGDDFSEFLKDTDFITALDNWADHLTDVAERIRDGTAILKKNNVTIENPNADVHFIGFELSEEDGQKVIDAGLIEKGVFSRDEEMEEILAEEEAEYDCEEEWENEE